MAWRLALSMTLALLPGGCASAGRTPAVPPSGDLVELDVVALDKQNRPVTDLRQGEFEVKEDGRLVDVKTFIAVATEGPRPTDDGRSVTLLMDDIGIPMAGTTPMQQIAQVLLSPAGGSDEVSVVRLSRRSDEAFGDLVTARERIEGYQGGAVPFNRRDALERALEAVARIAQQLEPVEHRRKVIICLGIRPVCDVEEPAMGASVLRAPWIAAIGAAARANVSVYAVDPTSPNASAGPRLNGLVRLTGGDRFSDMRDLLRATDDIWRESGHYYLLGYWPPTNAREAYTIDVKVARKNVHVRGRMRRAN